MQRYFANIINNKVILSNDDQHHLLHVMRCKVGEQIEVVDNLKVYVCTVSNLSPLEIDISYEVPTDCELSKEITLFFALAKGDKIDLVIQKATELGVDKIVLFTCKRCVIDFSNKDINKKLERYNKIAKEASEQCHRVKIPKVLGVVDIRKIPDNLLCDKNFVAFEKDAGKTTNSFNFKPEDKSLSIMIGPEGGFEDIEISNLLDRGFESISLGKRILRCETAAICSMSVLSYLLEK